VFALGKTICIARGFEAGIKDGLANFMIPFIFGLKDYTATHHFELAADT
jgi:hypothetical protein